MAFHAHSGWFFEREPNGSVTIYRNPGGTRQGADPIGTFDPDTWASIVASVSKTGEHGDTFHMAEWVHNAQPHDWVFAARDLEAVLRRPTTPERLGAGAETNDVK